MYFNALASLDCRPFLAELLHHFLPHKQRLIRELIDTFLGLFLELEQTETPLNSSGFSHQEFQIRISNSSLVRSPVLLDDSGCQNGALLSFKHEGWDPDTRSHFILVSNTIIEIFLLRLV